MPINIKETKEKIGIITKEVRVFGQLIDIANNIQKETNPNPTLSAYFEETSALFYNNAQDLEKGIFKLMVIGPFKNGKSTTINALIGENLLPTRSTACTAVVTVVKGGKETGEVTIYHKNGKPSVTMSLERFKQEYQITDKEIDNIQKGNGPTQLDRFANVDHAETVSSNSFFQDGVQIIDSPGLEENYSREIVTKSFVSRADAIIFELNATKLFSGKEVEYIKQQFYNKNAENVFFLINRINQIQSADQLEREIKPKVEKYLASVFTDQNGSFNKYLYNRRVFYVNALGAYCARTNTPYTVFVNGRDIQIEVTEKESGIPEFELSLNHFLNSEQRIEATMMSTLTAMASAYKNVKEQYGKNKKIRQDAIDSQEENIQESQKKLQAIERQIEEMKRSIRRASTAIEDKVFANLVSFTNDTMPSLLDNKIKRVDINLGGVMGMAKMGFLCTFGGEEGQRQIANEILNPFQRKIKNIVTDLFTTWGNGLPTLIEPEINNLKDDLGSKVKRFDLDLASASNLVYNSHSSSYSNEISFGGRLQQVCSVVLFGDASLALEIGAGGEIDQSEYISRTIIQVVLGSILVMITGGWALIPWLLFEMASMSFRYEGLEEKLKNNVGGKVLEEIKKSVINNEADIKRDIRNKIASQTKEITDTAEGLLKTERQRQEEILEEKHNSESQREQLDKKEDMIWKMMTKCFNKIFIELYGVDATKTDLDRLAPDN